MHPSERLYNCLEATLKLDRYNLNPKNIHFELSLKGIRLQNRTRVKSDIKIPIKYSNTQ